MNGGSGSPTALDR